MSDIYLDSDVSIPTIDHWETHWIDAAIDKATEGGKYPHRASSTSILMRCDTIHRICELARYAVRMKRASGKKANAVAAEKLRQIADQLESYD